MAGNSAVAIIVFARAGHGHLTSADSAKIATAAKSLTSRNVPNVVSVTAGPPSPNRLVQTALVAMPNSVVNGTGTAAGDAIKTLRADIKPLVATGLISDVNKALHLNADSSVSTILIVVLFGIGTDYILFLMFRYRERLRGGEDSKQAMASAVARVGEVISSAAGVVIVAFLALLLSTLSVLRSLGPTLAIAVAVTLIAGLTLVPAVVSLLGPRVFWPSKAWRREPKAARFAAIGRPGQLSSPLCRWPLRTSLRTKRN